jgi:hypothetical protein
MPKFLLNIIFLQFPHKVSSPSEEDEAEHMNINTHVQNKMRAE